MNKSTKKSGFQFSDDLFGFGEDETLSYSRVNHKRDILNMCSEMDFEKYTKQIKQDMQKASYEQNKLKRHSKATMPS